MMTTRDIDRLNSKHPTVKQVEKRHKEIVFFTATCSLFNFELNNIFLFYNWVFTVYPYK